jgi:hypothetical protein
MEDPKFEHDCDSCVFLGGFNGSNLGEPMYYDLYVCARDGVIDTLIGRYDDEPSRYKSGCEFVTVSGVIAEAGYRAMEKGFTFPAHYKKHEAYLQYGRRRD